MGGEGGWGDAGARLNMMSDLPVKIRIHPLGRLRVKSQRQVAIRHEARRYCTCFHCWLNAMFRRERGE